jgi:K+-sensing histidine kinase KdpD
VDSGDRSRKATARPRTNAPAGPHQNRQDLTDPRLQWEFAAAAGFTATLLGAALLDSARPVLSDGTALTLMTALVAALAWWSTWPGSVATAGCAWLMFNGFVVNGAGVLQWHGSADLLRLTVLFGTALAAALTRSLRLSFRRRRALTRWLQESPDHDAMFLRDSRITH